MKKTISIVIIGVLLLSGIGAVALPSPSTENQANEQHTIRISQPIITDTPDYTIIDLPEATRTMLQEGKPDLPIVTKVFSYPFGTQIKNVQVKYSNPHDKKITNPVRPAPTAIPLIESRPVIIHTADASIYSKEAEYPKGDFQYSVHVGLNKENIHTLFVSVKCYPIRYSPSTNVLTYYDTIDISIDYQTPYQPVYFGDSYDLVIIAPESFSAALQPLVDHKDTHGMSTKLETLESILSGGYSGRDDAEKVKYYIKYAVEEMGVTYVLLIGGMNGQKYQWLLPVRRTNNLIGQPTETGVLSDLYFADIYKYEGNTTQFEDWDSNGNDIFAEFGSWSKDILDLVPDVYVGRLPCRDLDQVQISVAKLIAYESTKADPSWFNNMLLIAGDTYQDSPGGVCEGEIATDYSASFMPGFTFERLWASNGALTGQEAVEAAINDGAGFVHMAGHANPAILVTHPPQDNAKITILRMYHLKWLDFFYYIGRGKVDKAIESLKKPRNPQLTNADKQPIIVIGGCHNSQYNTTLLNLVTMKPFFSHAYGWGEYVPKCFSWWLTNLEEGGAIATMGNTGLGMGYHDNQYTQGLDGWLMPQFFKHYGTNNITYLGAAHSLAIEDYALIYPINSDGADRQMLEQWALLGDPSMKIGGYD